MDKLLDFSGQVVLITGAADGFGRMLALELSRRGAKLVIGDIQDEKLQALQEQLLSADTPCVALTCDVSRPKECELMVATALEHFGHLDIAINNAGIGQMPIPLHQLTAEDLQRQLEVNLSGVAMGMKCQISAMLPAKRGHILNVSSMAGIGGAPMGSAYSAAKHGVIGLTKTAAVEYGRYGIRVNAVCPYFTPTNLLNDSGLGDDATLTKYAAASPMKRLAVPQEVVNAMVLMLSPANSFMTGQAIAIDGGVSAW